MQNSKWRKGAVSWSGRYNNGGLLRTARTLRNGRRLQHKVQNRKLRQGTVVRSCRYKKKEYCAQQAPDGIVNVKRRKFKTQVCVKAPSFGVAGTKTAEYCAQHEPDGMVNVCSKKCRTESCVKSPSFGVPGTIKREYCAQHAPNRMVDVKNRKCTTRGCGKGPLFGVASTTTAEYWAEHAPDAMVNVCRK